jgi:hypothetical protein
VFTAGKLIATLQKRSRSQEIVQHPDQFRKVTPTSAIRKTEQPLGHQVTEALVTVRPLAEYDQIFGLEVVQ